MGEIAKLKGLGPKSEQWLNNIGIFTEAQLKELGAVRTFIKLRKESKTRPSLNFLYALVGAIENVHWATVAKTEKARLLMELEGYQELEAMLKAEGVDIEL